MKRFSAAVFVFMSISALVNAHPGELLSTAGNLLPVFLLLLLVIIVSSVCRPRAIPYKTNNLADFAKDLFEFSDFPTAVFDLELNLVGANLNFSSTFKIAEKSLFNALTDPELAKIPGLAQLLNDIRNSKKPPEKPIFMSFPDSDTDSKNFAGFATNYLLVRKLVLSPTDEQLVVLIFIESVYARSFANDLMHKIAQRDSDLKKLEEIDQLKSEFLATLSHELKTPLVSIKGYLDLMASEKMGPLTEKQEKAVRVSLKNTSHLNSLISSILNFARMEAGKLLFDLSYQKLTPHVNDIIDSLKPISDNRQIAIVTDFEEPLPMVIIDAELIHRVLINLLENAIKFSSPGTMIKVSVSRHNDSLVKVEIKDQGRGIPQEKLEKIKTPFYQADKSDTRPTGGLGLGLAIAEKILVGHGTTLHIESKENVGTACSFYLKVAPPRV